MSQSVGRTDGLDRFAAWLGIGTSGLLLAGGLFMALSASKLRLFAANGPGSGFLPLIIGIALAIVAGLYLIQRVMELRGPNARPQHPALATDEPPPEAGLKRAGLIVASLLLLASALEYIGFQISMFAFLLFHLRVLGKRGWVTTVAMAAVGSFAVFALFSELLRVTLPKSDIPVLDAIGL